MSASLTKKSWESTENQLNSSGIFSQDFRHCRFFRKSRKFCKNGTLNLKNSQIGSSSCPCSTTSIGQEKATKEFVFQNQKKSRRMRRNSRRDTGRSSVLETRRSGMELFFTHLKEKVTLQPLIWWKDSKTPLISKSISALSRGILKNKNNRGTVHVNADASNTELLFRIIHFVSQLSIHGAVSKWGVNNSA